MENETKNVRIIIVIAQSINGFRLKLVVDWYTVVWAT